MEEGPLPNPDIRGFFYLLRPQDSRRCVALPLEWHSSKGKRTEKDITENRLCYRPAFVLVISRLFVKARCHLQTGAHL